jgi:DNA topoisomerase-1
VYVNDQQEGISRITKTDGFIYKLGSKQVSDKTVLNRIKSLVLPPAWQDVWICALPNGHLQATGTDQNGRKQYRYHPLWNALRSETKFAHLYDFGKALSETRKRLKADLALQGLPQQKVLAAIVSLMEYTGVRIGNSIYEHLYGSYGITTLRNNHVKVEGSNIAFSFRGKKGVAQQINLKSRQLAKIISQCREIPGRELFQYYDERAKKGLLTRVWSMTI